MDRIKTIWIFFLLFPVTGHLYAQTATEEGQKGVFPELLPVQLAEEKLSRTDSLVKSLSMQPKILDKRDSLEKKIRAYYSKAGPERIAPITKAPDGLQEKYRELLSKTELPGPSFDLPALPVEQTGSYIEGMAGRTSFLKDFPKGKIPGNFPQPMDMDKYLQKPQGYREKAGAYQSTLDSLLTLERPDLDSMALHYGEIELTERLEDKLGTVMEKGGLGQEADLKGAFESSVDAETSALKDFDLQRQEAKKIQKDHFADKVPLEEGKAKMEKAKNKYKALRDTRLPEEGFKRHGLKGYRFVHRWEAGANIQVPSFDPIEGEVQPFLAYRPDKKWAVGLGGIIGGNIGKADNPKSRYNGLGWQGYRAYSLFRIKKGFFLSGEYQNRNPGANGDGATKQSSLLLGGMGTEMGLFGNWKMRSTLLYRVNKKESRPGTFFQSPWQVNMGIVNFRK